MDVYKGTTRTGVFELDPCYMGFEAILRDPELYIAQSVKLLKNDATSTVALVDFNSHKVVIKRSNFRSLAHRAKYVVRTPRAFRSWRNARLLESIGVPTAKPIGYYIEKSGPFNGRSYFIAEYVQGMSARDYFSEEESISAAPTVHACIEDMLRRLAKAKLSHGDLNPSNVIIQKGRCVLIDLEGMRYHHSQQQALIASSRDHVEVKERWPAICKFWPSMIVQGC